MIVLKINHISFLYYLRPQRLRLFFSFFFNFSSPIVSLPLLLHPALFLLLFLTFSSTVSLTTLSFLSTPNFDCFLFPSPITFSHFFYFCCVHHLLQSLSIPSSLSFYSYTSHTFSHLFLCLYLN